MLLTANSIIPNSVNIVNKNAAILAYCTKQCTYTNESVGLYKLTYNKPQFYAGIHGSIVESIPHEAYLEFKESG